MNRVSCPQCAMPLLVENTLYCAGCGYSQEASSSESGCVQDGPAIILPPTISENYPEATDEVLAAPRPRKDVAEFSAFVDAADEWQDRISAHVSSSMHSVPTHFSRSASKGASQPQPAWQKVVETPRYLTTTYPPRPPVPLHARTVLRHIPYNWLHFPRILARPRSFFWLSLLFMLLLAVGSLFRITQFLVPTAAAGKDMPSITINPQRNVSVGERLTIQVAGFRPGVRVGLFLDAHTPIADTHGHSQLTMNQDGAFSDTITVSEYWGAGTHQIGVEDADQHQSFSVPILIIANLSSILPAHFHLKVASELDPATLDLEAGDQATNSVKSISLTNSGAGLLSWQATTLAPWLLISPQSGSVTGDTPAEVKVAVDRANLEPGHYNSDITFASSAGNRTLHITMQVSALAFGHGPVLQVTPALLSFNGVDGDAHLAPQIITISNPGALHLNWQASVSDPSWLTLSSRNGSLDASGSATTQVEVNSGALLPGSYDARVSFAGVASTPSSAQSVYINVTIKPGCSLKFSANVLSFIDVAQQTAPAAQTVTINPAVGCSVPPSWKAQSNTSWLKINQHSGTTPSTAKVDVALADLPPAPQVLNGSITFSYGQSTQVLLVNLTLARTSGPMLDVGTSALTFKTAVGANDPLMQSLPLTNTGDSPIAWTASVKASGGNWLSLDTPSGNLAAHKSTILHVSATLLSTQTAMNYTGLVKIEGHSVQGKVLELTVPVQLTVSAACTLQMPSDTITFNSYQGQPGTVHTIVMNAGGACKRNLNWTVTPRTTSGGDWLSAVPRSGTLTPNKSAATRVGVDMSSLMPGTYQGQLQIVARDSSNLNQIVAVKMLNVVLNVQPACTLLVPSQTALNFTSNVASATQTFTVGVTGNCSSGGVKVVATAASTNDWFSVSDPMVIGSGGAATFSVTAHMAGLTQATGSISLTALEAGIAIVGSPQQVTVNFTPSIPSPGFNVTVSPAIINADNGTFLRSLTISNTHGSALIWNATLPEQPGFVSIPAPSGTLAAGSSASISLIIDPTGVAAGTYPVHVVVMATDSQTGMMTGSVDVPVTIDIAAVATPTSTSTSTATPTAASISTAPATTVPPLIPTNIVAEPSLSPTTAIAGKLSP